MSGIRSWVRRALWDVVPRDQRDTAAGLRRRQAVVVGFIVAGAVVLGLSLRIDPGDRLFYAATFGLAALWTVGAFASGRLHLGRIAFRDEHVRPVATPIAIGLVLAGVFTFWSPAITAYALLVLIAAFAILRGVMEIAAAIRLRKEISNEWLLILSGALAVVFGVVVFAFPIAGALAVTLWIGAVALAIGVLEIVLGLKLRRRGGAAQPGGTRAGTA